MASTFKSGALYDIIDEWPREHTIPNHRRMKIAKCNENKVTFDHKMKKKFHSFFKRKLKAITKLACIK